MQPVPFLLKAPGFVCRLHCASEKSFEIIWMKCILITSSSRPASPIRDQPVDLLHCKSCSKQFRVDIRPTKIYIVLKGIVLHTCSCVFKGSHPSSESLLIFVITLARSSFLDQKSRQIAIPASQLVNLRKELFLILPPDDWEQGQRADLGRVSLGIN